jgi:DnaJ-class molecular chaperone
MSDDWLPLAVRTAILTNNRQLFVTNFAPFLHEAAKEAVQTGCVVNKSPPCAKCEGSGIFSLVGRKSTCTKCNGTGVYFIPWGELSYEAQHGCEMQAEYIWDNCIGELAAAIGGK